eukprot:XP_001704114.1 Hypothetical protein GL50803_119122 [Giardia lamblia ATCC 50803]
MLGKKKDRPALIIWLDKNVFSKEGRIEASDQGRTGAKRRGRRRRGRSNKDLLTKAGDAIVPGGRIELAKDAVLEGLEVRVAGRQNGH